MSVTDARVAVRKGLMAMKEGYIFACCGREKGGIYDTKPPENLIVNSRGYSFIERGRLGLWTGGSCLFCTKTWGAGTPYEWAMSMNFGGQYVAVKECKKQYGLVWYGTKNWVMGGVRTWDLQKDAQDFADAVNVLTAALIQRDPAKEAAEFDAFVSLAKAWRESVTKPALPDGAYRAKILAEESIREKNIEAALIHYKNGLTVEPLWPGGHFNAALLEAELSDFYYAVWHMKRYLALMPDALDAQAARDKMIIWENKAQTRK